MDHGNDRKRRRIAARPNIDGDEDDREHEAFTFESVVPESLRKSISPPAERSLQSASSRPFLQSSTAKYIQRSFPSFPSSDTVSITEAKLIPSPVQLSTVKELPVSSNVDTVSLGDILGDPLIKECWLFNYLIDVDFVMRQFDDDTRAVVQVKLVHGSWKKEDFNKSRIDEAATRYPNVQVITAYMPEAYGTHHSKMVILFRHDEQAQVVIVTANFIAQDWRMSQAIWRSPLLPLDVESPAPRTNLSVSANAPLNRASLLKLGSGMRFKHDLDAYLCSYGNGKTKSLVSQLRMYDFRSIRAALVASVPGKQNLNSCDPEIESLWGWPGLKHILGAIPTTSAKSHVVVQVSSIASMGEKWVQAFLEILATTPSSSHLPFSRSEPTYSLVFPTADEIRRLVDGYSAGGSIHMKTQSLAQAKQLSYLKPLLCHWGGDGQGQFQSTSLPRVREAGRRRVAPKIREAGRRRAAPHIKTYVRFQDESMTEIDWAMMTSANLSTQAWGAAKNAAGEVRICSYEIGVLVWPALWDEEVAGSAEMVPVFKKDTPDSEKIVHQSREKPRETATEGLGPSVTKTTVGWRMPYDLPLVPYTEDEMPWCATQSCSEPDWMGRIWPGCGAG